ncbi:SRPBCC family protein [Streptomyces sp. NPDC046831]|uniref:SRPBCC family protein n=1 Tax=Streptomyces sp. NPDC046831 TaxID=3154805 RepID=UPI0033D9BD8D
MKTDTSTASALRHDPLVRGLGVFSGLVGVPQVAAPGRFLRELGLADTSRARWANVCVGVRELAAAAGLLGRPHPAWLWGRVGGDVMDLTLLARALRNHHGRDVRRTAAATAALTVVTATDVYAAVTRTRGSIPVEVTAATTVGTSPDEAYQLWHRVDRLPEFMTHLDEVRVTGPGLRTSHWTATGPFGRRIEWEAETTQDVPAQLIAWRSCPGADIENSGEVRFTPAPGGRGTEVHVTLRYGIPAGPLGKAVAGWFGAEPHQHLDDGLRRFKQVAETGEVVRSDGAPAGKRARREFPQHPARPLTEDELKEVLS